MIKIRKGIFETNSSSMHSFVLNKKGKWSVDRDSFEPHIKKGVLSINMDGEYGWGPDIITDQYERACYVAVNSKWDDDKLDSLADLLKSELNVDEVVFDGEKDDDGDFQGYIDHQSSDLVSVVGSIRDFIFGDGTLYIDNDNGCNYEDEYEEIEKNPDLERFY